MVIFSWKSSGKEYFLGCGNHEKATFTFFTIMRHLYCINSRNECILRWSHFELITEEGGIPWKMRCSDRFFCPRMKRLTQQILGYHHIT